MESFLDLIGLNNSLKIELKRDDPLYRWGDLNEKPFHKYLNLIDNLQACAN